MKRALSMILVLVMVLSMVPVLSAAAAEPVIITSGTDVTATAAEPVTYTWTAEANGTLTVSMEAASPGWRYTISDAAGNTVGLPKTGSIAKSVDFKLVGGTAYTFRATGWSSSALEETSASISYALSFLADEGEQEIVKSDYEVSETALLLGDNTLTLLDTAVTTIYVFEPAETAVYTFTAPEGAILGYWGAGSWFLQDPNSTTNTYEWTCTGVGQSAYIGVSGVTGSFNLNVAKTGDYTVVEVPIVKYENKATLETFALPEGSKLGSYIDVTAETVHTAVLGEDGYYHLDSADGDVILVDMDYQDIVLSAALKSDRPVMYVWDHDENGNQVKYDIGDAVLAYEAVMDENGYYPLTEDLIYFYDNYANGAAIYTFHITGSYNEENVWMYCMRTVSFPDTTDPEETEPEVTEPEVTEPEVTEPEVSEPQSSEPASGTVVLDAMATATSSTKYTYKFTPETDGTLTVTVGDGTTNWESDVYSMTTFSAVASASGKAEGTYTAEVTAGKNYYIRAYASSGSLAATPIKALFTPAVGSTEPSVPEVEKNSYEISTTVVTAADSHNLTMLDTAVTTVFRFKPVEAGTYTITSPAGSTVGNWGTNASYLNDPGSTTNTCEWTCTSVGQSVYIGVSGVEGSFVLNVTLNESTEPDVSEPTEPVVPEPTETDPVVTDPKPSEPVEGAIYVSSSTELNTAVSNNTSALIVLSNDIDLNSSTLTIPDDKNIILDLNGCTLTSKKNSGGTITVNGTLTVQDTSSEGDGLIQNTSTSTDRGIVVAASAASLTVKSGNISSNSNGIRVESGSLCFEGGSVTATNYGIYVGGTATATISGGYINSGFDSFNFTVYAGSSATVYITDGYYNGSAPSGSGLTGRVSGGCFARKCNLNYLATDCVFEDRLDTVYLFEVINPNEPEEPEPSEPDTEPTQPSEPSDPETEPTQPSEPETSEPDVTEPSGANIIASGTNVAVAATESVTYTWTAESDGILTVTMGAATPGWRFVISDAVGNTIGLPKSGKTEKSVDFELVAGTEYTFNGFGWNTALDDRAAATISYTLSFVASSDEGGEVEKAEFEVSETPLALGDNTVTLLDTAITTIYVFEPTETGVYTFAAPAGAILGYWGAGSWFLSDPNSTTNTYEWTCTDVGQSAYIGVSGVEGTFTLNVEKTGDYTVVEIPIVLYENKAPLSPFTLPEGAVLGSYIDVTTETKITVVLGEDGYYHLNSADGPIVLVDMDYQDIILSAALQSDRPVMYAYVTDEDGNQIKYDIGTAIKEYEAVMDENGYYPLTEDLILFYDTYAVGAGTYTFYVTGDYNEENVWLYCMRTVTFPVNPVDSWNLVLEDDLKVNFYMNMGENDSVQVSVGGSTYTFNAADLEVKDGKYVVTISIAAAQMTDDITVQIVGSDEVNTYTVRGYADTVLADQSLSNYHALIKEMLNYGAAAQTYFEYNTEKLANAGITDVAANDVPETTTEMVVNDQIGSLAFYGASVVYRDKIAVRFYFTGSIDGINFGEYTVNEKGDMYYVEVANILPQDLDQQITVTATDAEGNTLTVTYGPMNYIVRMNAKGDENMQNLMKALYNYYLAAEALCAN